jgi:hypothetical protein
LSLAERSVGQELVDQGWTQGCLLPAIGHAHFERDTKGEWRVRIEEAPDPEERWIVITQACDIAAPTEPFIEAMSCSWHPKGSSQYGGANRGNSARHFLIRREEDDVGNGGALIANATRVIQVTKESLLGLTPELPVESEEQAAFARRLGAWLGGRYSRTALEQSVVETVQRPIVDALGALRPSDPAYDGKAIVREVRMFPLDGPGPYSVEFVLLVEDGVTHDDVRIAAFMGTLEEAINAAPGETQLQNCSSFTAAEMSVSEYENTIKIPLDHYTQRGALIEGAEPVRGIEHG